MRIKRFSARDLPQVVAQIKEEFGLQAIILSQRALPDGLVEVTAGVRDEDLPPGAPPFEESGAENPPAPWGRDAYAREAARNQGAASETSSPRSAGKGLQAGEAGLSPLESREDSDGACDLHGPAEEDEAFEGDAPFARALREEAEKPELSAAELAACAEVAAARQEAVRHEAAQNEAVQTEASSPRAQAKPMARSAASPSPFDPGKPPRLSPAATGVRAGALGPVGPAKIRPEVRDRSGRGSQNAQSQAAPYQASPYPDSMGAQGQSAQSAQSRPSQAGPSQAQLVQGSRAQAAQAPQAIGLQAGQSPEQSQAQAPPRSVPARAPTVPAPGRLMPRASGSVAPKPAPLTAPAMGAAAYRKVQAAPAASDVGREVVLLKEQVGERFEELKTLLMDLAHRQSLSERWRDRQDLVGLYRRLLGTGLSPQRAREFVEKSADSLEAWGGDLMEHLRRTVRPMIRCLSAETPLPRIVAMAGPSGSGKTTTLVRLAAFCQRRGQKVSAITLDTLKLGAAEQLSQYARIMGLGLKACQNKSQFEEALEIFEASDVIVVDTNSRDLGPAPSAGDTHKALMAAGAKLLLVLPAGLKTGDLQGLHSRLAGPDLLGLVLTKLDESLSLGNVMTFLSGAPAPLAFISSGPRTPEDFQAAKADRLIDYWLGAEE